MKITLSNEELKEVVLAYVENTLGIKGEVTVSKEGITVDTSLVKSFEVKKEEVKEEVKETPVTTVTEEPTGEPKKAEESAVVNAVADTVSDAIKSVGNTVSALF